MTAGDRRTWREDLGQLRRWRPGRRVVVALVLLTVLAGGLRFWELGEESFRLDEGASAHAISGSWGFTVSRAILKDVHPPGYYVALHAWSVVFGDGDAELRSLSTVTGTLTIPLLYLFVAQRAGHRAGVAAGLLLAFLPYHMDFSQQARMYAALGLAGTASWHAFDRRFVRGEADSLLYYGAATLASFSLHSHAVFLVAGQVGWLVLTRPDRTELVAAGKEIGKVLVAVSPFIGMLVYQALTDSRGVLELPTPSWREPWDAVANAMGGTLPALVAVVAIAASMVAARGEGWPFFGVAAAAMGLVPIVAAWVGLPVYKPYAIMTAYVLLVAWLASARAPAPLPERTGAWIVLALLVSAVPGYYAEDRHQQWDEAVDLVATERADDEVVILYDGISRRVFLRYWDGPVWIVDPPLPEDLASDPRLEGASGAWIVAETHRADAREVAEVAGWNQTTYHPFVGVNVVHASFAAQPVEETTAPEEGDK